MKTTIWLVAASSGLLAQSVSAQNLRPLPDGGLEHAESGWVFPKQIADFSRRADQCIEGTTDCAATYEDSRGTVATVYVYPATSRAADASFAAAKAVIEQDIKQAGFAQTWSEGPFRVGRTLPLVGEKIFYKVGIGPDSSQSNLYFFDTGQWIAKVRISGKTADEQVFRRTDDFVRELPWHSFGLRQQTCTGSACRIERPLAIHGSLPEMLAMLLVDRAIERVFPKDMPACDAAALEAALRAAPRTKADGAPEPIEAVFACTPGKDIEVSFMRLSLSPDVLSKLELEGADGLSLRGPIVFAVRGNGKSSVLTELRDGALGLDDVRQWLETVGSEARSDFAIANRDGKNPSSIVRAVPR